MSRSQKRAVVRGSLLLDMASRDQLSDRQKLAAFYLERDREKASGVSASICKYGASVGSGGQPAPIARESFASQSWEALKRALPPSYKRLLGEIERTNAAGRGSLQALPIRTGQAHDREASLIKRGVIAGFLEVVGDHYQIPHAEEA
jgi:hypothetical protein